NAWMGSYALPPDGKQEIYANSLAGEFIPTSDGVTLIRVEATADQERHPSIIALPGDALRNFASISWTADGIAWAHWSAFGTARADGKVNVLQKIPKAGENRPTFPLYSSIGIAPGGDCVAVIRDDTDKRELQAWNFAGASAPSNTQR